MEHRWLARERGMEQRRGARQLAMAVGGDQGGGRRRATGVDQPASGRGAIARPWAMEALSFGLTITI